MLSFLKREKYWIILFFALVLSVAMAICYKWNNELKFNFMISNNDIIVNLSKPKIYVKSVSLRNPDTSMTVFAQDVYKDTSQVVIKDYKKRGLYEGLPYYFLMHLEDSSEPRKQIDGVTICIKGTQVLQDDEDVNLEPLKEKCHSQ